MLQSMTGKISGSDSFTDVNTCLTSWQVICINQMEKKRLQVFKLSIVCGDKLGKANFSESSIVFLFITKSQYEHQVFKMYVLHLTMAGS